jgi:hypothetical protein
LASTTTSNGNYTFSNVPPGNYIVGAANITGYIYTNNTAYTYVNNNLQNVSVAIVNSSAYVLFGVYNNATLPVYTISGIVFYDNTTTHVYDGKEAPLPNWTIILNPSNGTSFNVTLPPYMATKSNSSGNYTFTGVPSGNYTLIEFLEPLYSNTTIRILNIDLIGNDITNFGDNLSGVNSSTTYNVSGTVYNDKDHSGNLTAGDSPLSNWIVYLLNNQGQPIDIAVTNGTGQYAFYNYTAGNYVVQEYLNSSWINTSAMSIPITITNANISSINFFVYQSGSKAIYTISGTKYNDTDDNGVIDSGDTPLGGWTFLLYSGIYAEGSTPIQTSVTNGQGVYTFSSLSNGTYSIVEVLKLGYANITARVQVVTISGVSLTVNFLNWIGSGGNGTGTTYSISGVVFNDTDHDGLPYNTSKGDTPLQSSRTIILYDASGLPIATTTSSSTTGVYNFTGLPNGTYTMYMNPTSGWTNSTPDLVTVTIAGSSNVTNFGIYPTSSSPVYVISGTVFNDSSDLGYYNGQPGINNWNVFLYSGIYNGTTFPVQITSTGSSGTGSYSFTNLPSGVYTVIETLQSGWTNTTSREVVVTITSSSNLTVNFGNLFLHPAQIYTISGFKFDAVDHGTVYNSTVDGQPLANWNFYISDSSGLPFAESTTNSSGVFVFSGLMNGTYTVFENLISGWTNSTSKSQTVTVSGSNIQLSFGNYQTGTQPGYSITGYVFNDTSGTGLPFGGTDTYWGGYTVSLLSSTGSTIASQSTNGSGYFNFMDVVNGNYFIQALPQSGYTNSTPTIYPITISGQSSGPWWFGFHKLPPVLNYTISGKVFNDTNGIGKYVSGDQNLTGWAVVLVSQSNVTTVNFTDANGNYTFTVANGNWTVEVPPQQGWSNTTNWTVPVTISSSSQIVNFGFNATVLKPQYSISAFVFNDTNQDGKYDTGDNPMANWIINLTYPSGTSIWGTTNSSGWAVFSNLTAGNYTLEEISPLPSYVNSTSLIVGVPLSNSSANASFGVYYNASSNIYSISGFVFNDTNRNGVYNSSVDTPLVHFPLLLIPSVGLPVGTYTDSNGNYSFASLSSGNYTIELLPDPGWVLTSPALQNVTIVNSSITNIDFSAYYNWFNVSGYVFLDSNKIGNGTYLPGQDYPLFNWTVDLKGQSGDDYVTTDPSGFYQYSNVVGGNYTLSVVIPPQGWANTTQTSVLLNLTSNVNQNFGITRNFTTSYITTYTASQWSANTGGYLLTYYSTVFGSSGVIQVGWIGTGYTITFGNPNFAKSNMTNYLGSSSTYPPTVLSASYIEPIAGPGGIFGADILALQLNYDYSNASIISFNPSFNNLTLYNYSPAVNGMTVSQILTIANEVLGGDLAANPWGTGSNVSNLDTLVEHLNSAFSTSDYSWANGHLF